MFYILDYTAKCRVHINVDCINASVSVSLFKSTRFSCHLILAFILLQSSSVA